MLDELAQPSIRTVAAPLVPAGVRSVTAFEEERRTSAIRPLIETDEVRPEPVMVRRVPPEDVPPDGDREVMTIGEHAGELDEGVFDGLGSSVLKRANIPVEPIVGETFTRTVLVSISDLVLLSPPTAFTRPELAGREPE